MNPNPVIAQTSTPAHSYRSIGDDRRPTFFVSLNYLTKPISEVYASLLHRTDEIPQVLTKSFHQPWVIRE
jgi:hypothetical protein